MDIVFHGSEKENLRCIAPRASTHGKKYVYATRHKAIALLFLCRWNDYLLTLEAAQAKDGLHITLVERYENALEEIFSHKQGYIYALDGRRFFSDAGCWEMEVVSEREEKPISCERVGDVLSRIISLEEEGVISLYRYPQRPPAIPDDDVDLMQKSIELYRLNGDAYNAIYCAKRFPHLKKGLDRSFMELFSVDLSSM